MRVTYPEYQNAMLSQSACNLVALTTALNNVAKKIMDDEHELNASFSSEAVNQHPIIRLYVEQLYHLVKGYDPKTYNEAHQTVQDVLDKKLPVPMLDDKPRDKKVKIIIYIFDFVNTFKRQPVNIEEFDTFTRKVQENIFKFIANQREEDTDYNYSPFPVNIFFDTKTEMEYAETMKNKTNFTFNDFPDDNLD